MISRLNKSGFTLVELLIAMAVASIMMTLIYQVYRSQLRTHTTQQELVEMQQNLRAALYLMERDIRMAGHAPEGGIADPAITAATINDVRFAMDISGGSTLFPSDGDTGDPGEQIRYRIDGNGDLVRDAGDGNGEQIILDSANINFLTFVYRDGDGVTLDDGGGSLTSVASLQAVRSVEITIDANIGTTAMVDPHQMTLTTEVKCRNLGLN